MRYEKKEHCTKNCAHIITTTEINLLIYFCTHLFSFSFFVFRSFCFRVSCNLKHIRVAEDTFSNLHVASRFALSRKGRQHLVAQRTSRAT